MDERNPQEAAEIENRHEAVEKMQKQRAYSKMSEHIGRDAD